MKPKTWIFLVSLTVIACSAQAQTWSHAPWTGDADSGINSSLEYTVAVNTCGEAVTVNGVTFQSDAASGTNFSITGDIANANSGTNITGHSKTLANSFIYGGNPRIVTLTNLTPGATYETTFFSYGWDPAGTTRIQTFAAGSKSLVLDQNFYGQGNGCLLYTSPSPRD